MRFYFSSGCLTLFDVCLSTNQRATTLLPIEAHDKQHSRVRVGQDSYRQATLNLAKRRSSTTWQAALAMQFEPCIFRTAQIFDISAHIPYSIS